MNFKSQKRSVKIWVSSLRVESLTLTIGERLFWRITLSNFSNLFLFSLFISQKNAGDLRGTTWAPPLHCSLWSSYCLHSPGPPIILSAVMTILPSGGPIGFDQSGTETQMTSQILHKSRQMKRWGHLRTLMEVRSKQWEVGTTWNIKYFDSLMMYGNWKLTWKHTNIHNN